MKGPDWAKVLTAQPLPDSVTKVAAMMGGPSVNTDPVALAAQQYPILKNLNVQSVTTPMQGDNRMLEFWPPDEPGDEQYPRPKELQMGRPGVQIISPNTKPSDVAADIVSHYLVNQDPKLSGLYQQFSNTFQSPEMQARLQHDYEWSKQNEGEKRPFQDWASITRIPDYFRGYMFKQWPASSYSQAYTDEQRALMDQMNSYITDQGLR